MRTRALVNKEVLAPGFVLFCVMTAHALLETARDALFLAHLGPQRLAAAYLAIALVALVAVTVVRRSARMRDPRRMLIAFLATAALGTGILAAVIDIADSAVFVLYVWTGLVATLVVPCFWTVLDRSVRIGQAKRMFAAIGAGGVVGALVGSALASALGRVVAARHLVTAGALVFVAATIAAIVLAPHALAEARSRRVPSEPSPAHSRRYLALLMIVGVASTIALTIGDITFKRVLAERIAKDDLATVFGAIYTGLNVIGLVIQLAVTPRLLAKLGVAGALTVLPAILASTALGFAITGAWIAVIAMKVGDGGLRHSLHRVGNEILFLAVPARVRDGAKPVVDAVAQRGGQAAAALLVFAGGALGAGAKLLAAVTAIAAGGWLIAISRTRRAYIMQFRDVLREGEVHRDVRVPHLDASSVDLLRQALASPDEVEALAALELLTVLDHSSQPQITEALAPLLAHADPQIRAAALGAASRPHVRREHVEAALDDPDRDVRAAALVALADEPELHASVDAGIAKLLGGTTADRETLACALLSAPHERFRGTLYDLLAHAEPSVMRIVLYVFARSPALADLDRLLPMLADPHVRGEARRVFVAAHGLPRLIAALDDPRLPLEIRQHVPRTISRFRTKAAASALVGRLLREPDGTTEYKILRALGRMRDDDPALPIDRSAIHEYIRRSVADAARFATLADELAARISTPDVDLVHELLEEKKCWAVEHAFRALGILSPRDGASSIYDALASTDDARRTAAHEIFEHVAPVEVREPLLAVIDDVPPGARRERLGSLAAGPFPTYEALLSALLAEPSASLRCLVAYHVAERKLLALRPEIARLRPLAGTTLVQHAFDQAIARLDA